LNARVREQLQTRLRNVLYGFWLVPGAVAASLAVLAIVLVEVDHGLDGDAGFFSGEADAARVVLSVVAGSLITVAGLAFSITVLTLQLVSSQYTPRAVRSLMGDRTTQVVAGAFVGVFAYCLLVLRSIREDFVPSLAISGAIVLGLGGLALLLVFIHHFGQSIKVDEICARISRETLSRIEQLYPEPYGDPEPTRSPFAGPARDVHVGRPGWVRAVAIDRLAANLPGARSVEVLVVPGDFVTAAKPVARVRPPEASASSAADAFEISRERDLDQDVGFGIRQLADVAVRALSPGVNDPTTAVTCIGYLGAILEQFAGKATPDPDRRFDGGLVVRAPGPSFERLVGESFHEIGRFGQDDVRVVGAVLDALERVGRVAADVHAVDRAAVVETVAAEIAGPALERVRTDRERMLIAVRAARIEMLGRDERVPSSG
jgi:uncharacterized membrane protein